jgi:Toprim domain
MTALRSAADILHDFRVSTPSSAPGRYYATCPECSHKRKQSNQKLKCLGVTIDERGVQFGCNHCGLTGGAFYESGAGTDRHRGVRSIERADPAVIEKVTAKARAIHHVEAAKSQKKVSWLWASRKPLKGSIAEIYLRECRGYRGRLPPTLGFLPATDVHPPSMIAAFGMARETEPGELVIDHAAVTGIHITKLKPDGSDKAGTEADKLTIGIANKSPIVLAAPNDLLGLAISEGIEDALSAHQATGLGAWAAGTAGRLPAMAELVPDYIESVTVLVDDDENGRKNSNELARRLTERGIEVLMSRPEISHE